MPDRASQGCRQDVPPSRGAAGQGLRGWGWEWPRARAPRLALSSSPHLQVGGFATGPVSAVANSHLESSWPPPPPHRRGSNSGGRSPQGFLATVILSVAEVLAHQSHQAVSGGVWAGSPAKATWPGAPQRLAEGTFCIVWCLGPPAKLALEGAVSGVGRSGRSPPGSWRRLLGGPWLPQLACPLGC